MLFFHSAIPGCQKGMLYETGRLAAISCLQPARLPRSRRSCVKPHAGVRIVATELVALEKGRDLSG